VHKARLHTEASDVAADWRYTGRVTPSATRTHCVEL